MYLQLLQDIVKIQTDWENVWPKLDAKRKQLAIAVADLDIDTSEVAKYVTTASRMSKLDLPEVNELRQAISDKAQAVFDSRSESIYEAQLVAQTADEALAALLTDPELQQMRKDLDNLVSANSDTAPAQTRHLVMRRGARLAVNALHLD